MCTSKHQACCLLLGASGDNQLFLGVECVCEFEGLADAKGRKAVSEWQHLSRSSPETSPIGSPAAQTAGQRAVNSSAAGAMEATVGVRVGGGGSTLFAFEPWSALLGKTRVRSG